MLPVAAALLLAAHALAAPPEPAASASPSASPDAAAGMATPAPVPAATLAPADVERLEALGYLDTVPGPSDPAASGVLRRDAQRSWRGYDLFTNAHACSTDLLDPDGKRVHRWSLTPCSRWGNSVLLPDGDLLVVGQERSSPDDDARASRGAYVARLAWDGSVRWKKRLRAHHDVQPTPRGEIVVLTTRARQVPEIDPDLPVRDDAVTLLSSAGEVIGEASLIDLLRAAPAPFRLLPGRKKKLVRDLVHANSVAWMPPALAGRDPLYAPSNLLVCMRHQNAIAVIDWDRKKVVWTWGQGPGELSGPHDAVVLPDGHFLVFDNGRERTFSRVLELDPLTKRVVWEYTAKPPESFKTQTRGSNQRLPNGNTLIAESDRGRAFEVTPEGEVVWEMTNPNIVGGERSAIVRIRRLAPAVVEPLLRARTPEPHASPRAED
jgi:Arylsulfotransferase (ASST)